jgi:hypothetical protein
MHRLRQRHFRAAVRAARCEPAPGCRAGRAGNRRQRRVAPALRSRRPSGCGCRRRCRWPPRGGSGNPARAGCASARRHAVRRAPTRRSARSRRRAAGGRRPPLPAAPASWTTAVRRSGRAAARGVPRRVAPRPSGPSANRRVGRVPAGSCRRRAARRWHRPSGSRATRRRRPGRSRGEASPHCSVIGQCARWQRAGTPRDAGATTSVARAFGSPLSRPD